MTRIVWELLISFGQIGLFALGGGNSMIKLIEDECVNNRAWLTLEEFSSLLGVSFLFPGLTAVKLSALIGLKVAGIPGMVAGVVALNLPGLVLATAAYGLIIEHRQSPLVGKLVLGMQYGAVALLGAALYSLTKPLVMSHASLAAGALAIGLFIAVAFFEISPFIGIVVFVAACLVVL